MYVAEWTNTAINVWFLGVSRGSVSCRAPAYRAEEGFSCHGSGFGRYGNADAGSARRCRLV